MWVWIGAIWLAAQPVGSGGLTLTGQRHEARSRGTAKRRDGRSKGD